MQSLVHFTSFESIENSPYNFGEIAKIKADFSEFSIFDFDNFSDSMMMGFAEELLKKSSVFVFWLKVKPEHSLGVLPTFIRKIFREKTKKKCFFIVDGENQQVDLLLKAFSRDCVFRESNYKLISEKLKKLCRK